MQVATERDTVRHCLSNRQQRSAIMAKLDTNHPAWKQFIDSKPDLSNLEDAWETYKAAWDLVSPVPAALSEQQSETESDEETDTVKWKRIVGERLATAEANGEPPLKETWEGMWWAGMKGVRFAYTTQFGVVSLEELQTEPFYS